jgi:hypothetical protein
VKVRLGRALRAFGHFWWDFLVGDTPEFAVATLLIVGLAFLLHSNRTAATVLLPLVTAVFLATSTYRGRKRPSSPPPPSGPQARTTSEG